MKNYRVLYRLKGYVDIEAKDAKAALEEFDSLPVKRVLLKSNHEKIEVIER